MTGRHRRRRDRGDGHEHAGGMRPAPSPGSHREEKGGHGDRGHRHGPHGHTHAHGRDSHARLQAAAGGQRGLTLVLGITAAFMVAEFVGGVLANSLALLADAAHMLADVGSLALSLFALRFARRPATPEKTYGYVRIEILAALLNAALLLGISGWVVWEAIRRLGHPEPVRSGLMLAVAAAGLLANVASALVLHRRAGESLNVRGAYLHVLGDLLGSAGAIVAALVILTTGWYPADPIISFLVSGLVVASSWHLMKESIEVLLEAVPAHIDLDEVRSALGDIPGVEHVHDLHVWTVTSGFLAMSGHAVTRDPGSTQRILDEAHRRMRERFGIRHATIQLECPAPVKIRGRNDHER